MIRLCRLLAIGLITVSDRRVEPVEIHCEPGPYKPRMNGKRKASLLSEFERRSGDHNVGGSTRKRLVTAYREDALRVASFLDRHGPAKVRDVREGAGVGRCGAILRDNYYAWFERVAYGVYGLTPKDGKPSSSTRKWSPCWRTGNQKSPSRDESPAVAGPFPGPAPCRGGRLVVLDAATGR